MKTIHMKALFFFFITLVYGFNAAAQADRVNKLENIEQGQGQPAQGSGQQAIQTATVKSAARLFEAKNDLTTVIVIIPSGSRVTVLDSDSTYYRVKFEDSEGYVLRSQAVIDDKPVIAQEPMELEPQPNEGARPVRQSQISRFSYLENKYGTSTAARINSGKIWKGMNGEMVKDSWGNPNKINRVISNNTVKEEWTYKSTILYFQNNKLVEWGPVK